MALGTLAALEQRITVAPHHDRHDQRGNRRVPPPPAASGRADPLFTDDATALIHESGRGKPRAVNRLALAALIAACAAGKNLVDQASARSAVTETSHDPHPHHDALTIAATP